MGSRLLGAMFLAVMTSVTLHDSRSATLEVLHKFEYADGCGPKGGLTVDPDSGTLYGTAAFCGSAGGGTVFSLTPPANGALNWKFRVIHDFTDPDRGKQPESGLTLRKVADDSIRYSLWGTTQKGKDQGTLFFLAKRDGVWSHGLVHNFSCAEGAVPNSSPVFSLSDPHLTSVYGTTSSSTCGSGIIYRWELYAGPDTFRVIYNPDVGVGTFVGYHPQGVIVDGNGTIFGTASQGGEFSSGTVFRMDQFGKGKILHSFNGENGRYPAAPPILDSQGGLWGTTASGGKAKDCPNSPGCGVIWQKPPLSRAKVKHSFRFFIKNKDGMAPNSPLVLDEQTGTLYGTTYYGGTGKSCGGVGGSCGTIFKIGPEGAYETLWQFPKGGPASPQGQLVFYQGALYGTSFDGGRPCPGQAYLGCGTVWKLTP